MKIGDIQLRQLAPSILTGIMIGTSYIPFPPWALLFCFVPLWTSWLNAKSLKEVIITGWLAQAILTFIGFNWVAHTVHEFGRLPWVVAIPTLILFCAIANLFVPIAGALWWWLNSRRPLSMSQSFVVLAVFTALAHEFMWTLFPWNFGYTLLWMQFPAYNVAEIIGFQGLSTLACLGNVLMSLAWHHRRNIRGLGYVLSTMGLFIALNAWGHFLAQRLGSPEKKLRVLIVQANIGNLDKYFAEFDYQFRPKILDKYLAVTEGAVSKLEQPVDFMIWPETAFPDDLGAHIKENANSMRLKSFLRDHQLSLATGSYSEEPETGLTLNGFFVLDENGNYIEPHYYKTTLLAFGEYLPLGDTFPKLYELLPAVGHFGRGGGPVTVDFKGIKFGPQICYEGLFPNFSRQLAARGAHVFVNVTNDSWYGQWQEPYQHLYMTLARAIEFRRPLVRSTNTGISTVISAKGEIGEFSPLHAEWSGVYSLPYFDTPIVTFYQENRYIMYFVMLGLLILTTLSALRIKKA